ncbi:MAG TPA: hypothetical protein PL124_02995 [Candidatus Cloacimonadota bacterium]|nr:hypothetical protein [Candidatus Cloacimonadota bacterium]HPS38359.1 hypothetical protein [Candidatus Cloacimonadota bacterium]
MLIDLSNYRKDMKDHAEREMHIVGLSDPSSPDGGVIYATIVSLMRMLNTRDHSKQTLDLITTLFSELVHMKILSPLTGDESEWLPAVNGIQKNLRMPAVYRTIEGAFYSAAIVWQDVATEKTWIGALDERIKSDHPITFPWVPASVMVRVQEIENRPGEFEPVESLSMEAVRLRLDELYHNPVENQTEISETSNDLAQAENAPN